MGARGGVGGLFGGRGAEGVSTFGDLFFPLTVLAPLTGVSFVTRFSAGRCTDALKQKPFFLVRALCSTPRGDHVVRKRGS